MKSINLTMYKASISQITDDCCIPATIEGMIKFHDPALTINQDQKMQALQNAATDNQPSFKAAEKANSQFAPPMGFKELGYATVGLQNKQDFFDEDYNRKHLKRRKS